MDIVECEEASYQLLARLAQIYMQGGHKVEPNCQEAADLFSEAAERATASGKGRLASKYYELAEQALAATRA